MHCTDDGQVNCEYTICANDTNGLTKGSDHLSRTLESFVQFRPYFIGMQELVVEDEEHQPRC